MGRVKKVEKGWRAGKGEGRGSSARLASGQAGKKKRAGRGNWAAEQAGKEERKRGRGGECGWADSWLG